MRRIATLLLVLILAAPAAAGAAGGDKKSQSPYLQLPSVAASVLRGGGRRGVMTVEVGIDAPDASLRDRVQLVQPILRDAFVSVLQPYALSISPGSPPSADYIAMTLQHETDRVLGRRGARLLLGSILIN